MSCPVMHEQTTTTSGGCPVMHHQEDKVYIACEEEIKAFNNCQVNFVAIKKTRDNCEHEANLVRMCELARRNREKISKNFQECIKQGGDSVSCLKLTQ